MEAEEAGVEAEGVVGAGGVQREERTRIRLWAGWGRAYRC